MIFNALVTELETGKVVFLCPKLNNSLFLSHFTVFSYTQLPCEVMQELAKYNQFSFILQIDKLDNLQMLGRVSLSDPHSVAKSLLLQWHGFKSIWQLQRSSFLYVQAEPRSGTHVNRAYSRVVGWARKWILLLAILLTDLRIVSSMALTGSNWTGIFSSNTFFQFQRLIFAQYSKSNSNRSHAWTLKPLQLCIILKDGVILEHFAKRMEGNGHLGPDKSCFDNLTKTSIGHGDRMQGEFEFDMRSAHCAWNFDRREHKS